MCVYMMIHARRGKFEVIIWIYELQCFVKIATDKSLTEYVLYSCVCVCVCGVDFNLGSNYHPHCMRHET